MKVNEVLLENKNNAFIKQHIHWLADQLDIKKLPKITLLNDPVDTTFGQYDPDTKSIKLVTGGRHPVDVLRTLAHELTHYKQDIENNLPDGAGETGTDQENEANANAGIVMRDFAQENPDQFGLDKGVAENFADGKGPGQPGDSVRHGIPKKATMAELEKASHAKGRKGQLARWQINMRNGKK
jgi:hypothetical protein